MSSEGVRTATAQQAIVMADLVNQALANRIVGSEPPKRLMIRELDVPSTDGGKRARQSIALLPVDSGLEGSTMCGWIDIARSEAELRTHGVVAKMHEERYGRRFDVSATEYGALMAELLELFALDSIDVHIVDLEVDEAPTRFSLRRVPPVLMLAAGMALVILVTAIVAIVR